MSATSYFLWNVLLALVWAAANGRVDSGTLLLGFVLGHLCLALSERAIGQTRYGLRVWRFLRLLSLFSRELVVSTLQVALDVLTPGVRARPRIVGIPLDAESDLEIFAFANLLSVTPGSLALDVSPDRKTLYVHAMFAADRDAFVRRAKERLERPILEVTR